MLRRILAAAFLALTAAALAPPAQAQPGTGCNATMGANTVCGRLGISPGPPQAIPLTALAAQLAITIPTPTIPRGTVQVWPVQGSSPNTVGNLFSMNAYGTSLGCSTKTASQCIQAAMDAAAPASGNIFTLNTQRDLNVQLGYGGLATIDQRGYQNLNWTFTGLGFYVATLRSCEMCNIAFLSQVDSLTLNPNDAGAPGGDSLFQIVDSRYTFHTLFKLVVAKPSITNSEIFITEFNVSSPSLINGWDMPSVTSGQNFGNNKITALHAHSDNGGGLDTYFKIGDGAPAGGQTFGWNTWDLHIDNTDRDGSQDGFVSYASNDILTLRAQGITTGNTIWWRSGAQDNIAILQTDLGSATPVTDANGSASTNFYIWGGHGIWFGGKRYAPLGDVSTYGFAYINDHPNGQGRVIEATATPTNGQIAVGQTGGIPLAKSISGDATLSATGALTIANDSVTYAKMQNVSATSRVIGRATAGAGDPEELTVSQVLDFLTSTRGSIVFRGASGWINLAPGTSGLPLISNGAGADPAYAALDLSGSAATGTLAAARMPALTGDCTTSAGAVATTCAKASGGFQIGSGSLTASSGELALTKIAATGVAAGAAGGKMELVCGTNAGTAKLIAYAGTSTTPVTILDNIGSGVTGC